MFIQRTAAVALRQYYLLRGSLARVLPLFAWVAIDIILWGFITRYLNAVTSPGFDFVPVLLGAVLLWDFFGRVMHGVATAFLEDIWSRNFLNIFSTPLTIAEYLSGMVVTSIVTSIAGLLAMLILAMAVFGLSFAAYGVMFIPFLLVLLIFGIGLGIFSIGIVLRLGPASEWFVWPVPALISPFAGVFYPISTLPEWMQAIAYLLPPAYVFEGMRGIIAEGTISGGTLLLALGLDFVYVGIACWFFTAIYRRAVRSGLLARYSAESVP